MKGLNRIGNMLVPNSNYCKFEDWIIPILDACLKVGRRGGHVWHQRAVALGQEQGRAHTHPGRMPQGGCLRWELWCSHVDDGRTANTPLLRDMQPQHATGS